MKINSVQGRLGLLFLAFLGLLTVAVGVTMWGLESQRQDALVINLAGRQRMLVQQMAREAIEIGMGEREHHAQILSDAIQTYDQTLTALQDGGPAPYLPGRTALVPPAREDILRAQLDQVQASWVEFHSALETLLAYPPESSEFQSALQNAESLSSQLVNQSDAAVRLYEAASSQKVIRLRLIQVIFFASALVLLAAGSIIVRSSVTEPLKKLGNAAERIGAGDLSTPVETPGTGEIRLLAENFETMRARLESSQAESLAWTDSLEQRVAQRTQELEALYSVSREISSQLDINHVLRSVTQKTQELLGCEVVFLCLLDQRGQVMSLRATHGPESAICQTTSPVLNPTVDRVLAGDQALRCDNIGCQGYCEILAEPFRISHLAAPLKIGRQVIGALCVGCTRPGVLTDEAMNTLTKLANVTAVALQNARLYEQAERAATLEERQRIAAEMHDGLAQTLSFLQITIDQAITQVETDQEDQAIQTLERTHEALDRANLDTRKAIASLQEQGPVWDTLQDQLSALAEEFSNGKMPIQWKSAIQAPLIIPRQEMEQVLRVAREALLNAQRHSQAKRVQLKLERTAGEWVVLVEDDGQGFDPDQLQPGNGGNHFGLNIMRARAARIGGQVEIQSRPGIGTCIRLSWPVTEGI